MSTEFHQLLARLRDERAPFPHDQLALLSDLDSPRLLLLRDAWPAISSPRRQLLLEALRHLADDHIEYSFEEVNRLALEDPEVRSQGISNLWECEDPALIPIFAEFLQSDADREVRMSAAASLGAFVLLGELERVAPEAHTLALAALLHSHAKDTDPEVRLRSLESLGYSSAAEVPPLIESAFNASEEGSRRSAVIAMGRSANRRWAPIVLPLLTHPSPTLRQEAARAAGELEMRQAIPALVELLEDVTSAVRHAAIWSLGQMGGPTATTALERLAPADSEEAELVEEALENLAFLDGTPDLLLYDFDDTQEDPS